MKDGINIEVFNTPFGRLYRAQGYVTQFGKTTIVSVTRKTRIDAISAFVEATIVKHVPVKCACPAHKAPQKLTQLTINV